MAFEELHSPSFYAMSRAVAGLYSYGVSSGVVLRSGHSMTEAVSVVEPPPVPQPKFFEHPEPPAIHTERVEFGGADVSRLLQRQLEGRQFWNLDRTRLAKLKSEIEVLPEAGRTREAPPTLTAAGAYPLGLERFECTESLFQPSIAGIECDGIHELIAKCIARSPTPNKAYLWENIVLTGGNTGFPHIADRLKRELQVLVGPGGPRVHVRAAPERSYAAWLGGSVMASLPCCFYNWWISSDEYNDVGLNILEKKCRS